MRKARISYIRAEDIPYCLEHPWRNFSWGDAYLTLVDSRDLLSELEGWDTPEACELRTALLSLEGWCDTEGPYLVGFNG